MRTLKVVTLNCWAIFSPFPCEYKDERVEAIAEKLSDGEHDIILLQEIWSESDYKKICGMLDREDLYPHHNYYYSGMFSTGICIFSKHPIVDTFYMNFPLSGYPHKVLQKVVDWFISKGVALTRIQCGELTVNVYITHLHGGYDFPQDEFRSHRVTQAFQLSQFINLTRRDSDVVILGGDFNIEPTDIEYRIITTNTGLHDAWISQKHEPEDKHGATCSRPDNSFSTNYWLEYWLKTFPNGQRLDYIMYAPNKGHNVSCEECYLSMTKIPGLGYNYSDHEGVTACLNVEKAHNNDQIQSTPFQDASQVLEDTLVEIDNGLEKVKRDRKRYGMWLIATLFVLFYTSGINPSLPFGLGWFVFLLNFVLTLVCGYFLWMNVYILKAEIGYLRCEKVNVRTRLRQIRQSKNLTG